MRRLVVIVLVVIAAVGAAGTRAETAPYSQVVDSGSEERFEADESWQTSSYGLKMHGNSYRFTPPAEDGTPARFKIEIPETAKYAVYVKWPEVEGLNESVPVGVETTSGTEWRRMNQQRDGGRWVRVGVFEMEEGDGDYVRFSPAAEGEGYVAADAVKVVRASLGDKPSMKLSESEESRAKSSRREGSGSKDSRSKDPRIERSTASKGEDVVREASKWVGTRYRLGGSSRSGIDCSGLTMVVYRKFDVKLPHWDEKQYRYGTRVTGALRPGDLVFFDEHREGISHVGIYSGNGKLIHASDYFNKVVESDMEHIKGFKGARRFV